MSHALRHPARVDEEGKLVFSDPPAWRRAVAHHRGRMVWVSVVRQSTKATHNQHGYYRAEVLPFLAEEWGWGDVAELHHALKVQHLPGIIPVEDWPRRKFGADWSIEVPSSAEFSVEQFSRFLQAVLDQAIDAGSPVPPPRGAQ